MLSLLVSLQATVYQFLGDLIIASLLLYGYLVPSKSMYVFNCVHELTLLYVLHVMWSNT